MWTKRTIAAVTVAGLTAAGVAGVAVAAGTGDGSGRDGVLDHLLSEGTISQEEVDAATEVWDALREEREDRWAERRAEIDARLSEVAAAAGVTVDELQERVSDGETLAEIAGGNAAAVEDVLRQHAQERIDAARDRLDEREASIAETVDRLMDSERGPRLDVLGGGHRGGPGGGPGGHGGGHAGLGDLPPMGDEAAGASTLGGL